MGGGITGGLRACGDAVAVDSVAVFCGGGLLIVDCRLSGSGRGGRVSCVL